MRRRAGKVLPGVKTDIVAIDLRHRPKPVGCARCRKAGGVGLGGGEHGPWRHGGSGQDAGFVQQDRVRLVRGSHTAVGRVKKAAGRLKSSGRYRVGADRASNLMFLFGKNIVVASD